jgi:hypothetical protein
MADQTLSQIQSGGSLGFNLGQMAGVIPSTAKLASSAGLGGVYQAASSCRASAARCSVPRSRLVNWRLLVRWAASARPQRRARAACSVALASARSAPRCRMSASGWARWRW